MKKVSADYADERRLLAPMLLRGSVYLLVGMREAQLNTELKTTVANIDQLRADIDVIVAEIEGA